MALGIREGQVKEERCGGDLGMVASSLVSFVFLLPARSRRGDLSCSLCAGKRILHLS